MPGPFDLVLMAGEDNLAGFQNPVDGLARRWRKPVTGAWIWQSDEWCPLQPGGGYQEFGYGPEISFAHEYLRGQNRPTGDLGIVRVAIPATGLGTYWDETNPGGLFQELVRQARAAMADRPVILRGLIWVHGNSDSGDKADANAYKLRLENFVTALRESLGAPDMPVISAIIDFPQDQYPHSSLVRKALSDPDLGFYTGVDCRGLPTIDSGHLLTSRATGKLGRRLSESLIIANRKQQPLYRQWLWNSAEYHCWYEGPALTPKKVLVSFPYAAGENGFEANGFGQSYFRKNNMSAIYIRERVSNWFQDAEIFELSARIRKFLGENTQVVTYGVSMGGYGAMLLSKSLAANKVIVVAPQYSIDRTDVPFENRWKRDIARIGKFRHRLEDHFSDQAKYYVFYDPLSLDRHQVNLLPQTMGWHRVKLPLSSHMVLQSLKKAGLISQVLDGVFEEGPDIDRIVREFRQSRRSSKSYWLNLARASALRRPLLALSALDHCEKLGGPPRRIRELRLKIETHQERGQA